MFRKIKQKFESASEHHKSSSRAELQIPQTDAITKKHIYRNRYNYGVNLGACFVHEPWIYDTIFDKGGENEFDAMTKQIKETSVDEAATKLHKHYEDYVAQIDWHWLKEDAGITAFRVPIGYWHVGNGKFVDGLPFGPLKEAYEKALPWDALKDIIRKAEENDIGVLLDVHGLPGGANTQAHSGCQNESASFFDKSGYVNKIVDEVLPFIVRDICTEFENVIGLQIVNEADFDNNAKGQKHYYEKAAKAIQAIDSSLPVVISDGWWPDQWSEWVKKENLDTTVVIDSHVYRCFSDDDKSKNAGSICDDMSHSVNFPKHEADYVVGEFSCVLDSQTWDKTKGARDDLVKKFGNNEVRQFCQVASWGWFFWTLQFKYGDGGEWGLVPMVNKGAIPRRPKDGFRKPDDNEIENIVKEHINYWQDKGGDKMEHRRFEDGLRGAIADIESFDKFNNSRLGRWHSWSVQRGMQYIQDQGESEYQWEWEQGYQRALDEFNKC